VLDLGGGTVDVSVVRRQQPGEAERGHAVAGFAVLATHGDPNFGGADIDQLLLEHVGALVSDTVRDDWRALTEGREMSDRRRRRVLRQDVRGAKETLSRHTYTDVPMPPPFPDAHVTREDLERLVDVPLRGAVALTVETVAEAGLRPEQLAGVFLVGGSSRIPLVARLVYQRLGVIPTTLDQPETVVARGALRAVTLDPLRTGGLSVPWPAGHDVGEQPTVTMPAYPPRPPASPPAPARRRGGRKRLASAGAAVAVVVALLVVVLVRTAGSGGPPLPAALNPAPGQHLVAQYDYRFTTPKGWAESASSAPNLEVAISPTNAAVGEDMIYVREYRLSYDSTKDRARAVGQLGPQVKRAGYLNFTPTLTFANRMVAYYQQPGNDATADWYVLFQGRVQISIGCQYPATDQVRVQAACRQVVAGMVITR
jgi:type VII secretion-associated protein (TIGR03931 family)